MQSQKSNQSPISLFLAKNIYPWLITLIYGKPKYGKTISGLLPAALQNPEDKEKLNSVLEKWSNSSDDEIKTISKLLQNAIKLKEWSWLIALIAVISLGTLAAIIYSVLYPGIPSDSQCSIGEDCTAIAEGATVSDQEYTGNDSDYKDLNNSKLAIDIIGGATGNDRLTIHHQSNKLEEICVMGNQVVYQSLVIARFTEGKGSQPLTINFKVEPPTKTANNTASTTDVDNPSVSNSSENKTSENSRCITDGSGTTVPTNITPQIVQTVLSQIIYRNNQTSEIGVRDLEIKLNDGNRDNEAKSLTIALVEKNKHLKLELPNSKVVKENRRLNINGIKITKINLPNNQDIQDMTLTLEVSHGKITINDQVINRLTANNTKDDREKKAPPTIEGNKTKQVTRVC